MRFWIKIYNFFGEKRPFLKSRKTNNIWFNSTKKKGFSELVNVVPFFSSWIVFNTNTFINYSCRFHLLNCVYLFICIPLRIILPVWNFIQSRRRSPGVSWCANPTDFTVRMKMQMKKNQLHLFLFLCMHSAKKYYSLQ